MRLFAGSKEKKQSESAVERRIFPARVLWQGFNPVGFDKGIFVLLRGYIDESHDSNQNIFAFSCLISSGEQWDKMESEWKSVLSAKNEELRKNGRREISRYHASDCSACQGEFAGWSRDERDAFVITLFELFRKFPSHTTALDIQLNDLCEFFPEWSGDRLASAYFFLTGFLMHKIVPDIEISAQGYPFRIVLFHDRTGGDGRYDSVILRSFNQQKNDLTFPYRDYYTTVAPLGWQDSIALQPADLVAFECYKQAEARLASRKSRKSFTALINMGAFGIHSMSIDRSVLQALRSQLRMAL